MNKIYTKALHKELTAKNYSVHEHNNMPVVTNLVTKLENQPTDVKIVEQIIADFDQSAAIIKEKSKRIDEERVKKTESLVPKDQWLMVIAQALYLMQMDRKGRATKEEVDILDKLENLMTTINIQLEDAEIEKDNLKNLSFGDLKDY